MDEGIGTERLLGTLISRVTNVENGVEKLSTELQAERNRWEARLSEQQKRWEDVEKSIRDDVQHLRDFTIELKGGRKVLVVLLAVASAFGALIWEIVKKGFFGG